MTERTMSDRPIGKMVNRKKGMCFVTFWIEREEEILLKALLSKEIKTDRELQLIGDILSRVNAMGDLK